MILHWLRNHTPWGMPWQLAVLVGCIALGLAGAVIWQWNWDRHCIDSGGFSTGGRTMLCVRDGLIIDPFSQRGGR